MRVCISMCLDSEGVYGGVGVCEIVWECVWSVCDSVAVCVECDSVVVCVWESVRITI